MPERPRPDMDHTREALRQHDERVAEDEEDEERDPGAEDEASEPPSEDGREGGVASVTCDPRYEAVEVRSTRSLGA